MFKVGEIYLIEHGASSFISNPQNPTGKKYSIVVGLDGDFVYFFVINTEAREIYHPFKISSSAYTFLRGKDRYVGCAKAVRYLTVEIKANCIRETKETLSEADLLLLRNHVAGCKTLIKRDKNIILASLPSS